MGINAEQKLYKASIDGIEHVSQQNKEVYETNPYKTTKNHTIEY